jgi:CheY-like chemotaxis protein
VERPRTILLAEDEALIRMSLSRVLERGGHRVLLAKDGLEAVDLFRAHAAEVAAAVLDVVMPRMQGPMALAQMRALSPHLPAVLMSGYAAANDVALLAEEGKVRFLTKPFRLHELARIVTELTAT